MLKEEKQLLPVFDCLGNGDPLKGEILLRCISQRVHHARKKHPVFAEGLFHALGVIESEFHELEYAIEHESEDRQRDEALDVIATCFRFLCGEHKQESQK